MLTFIDPVVFGRPCIPPRGVARRSNPPGSTLLAPCGAGASAPSVRHRIYERQHFAMKQLVCDATVCVALLVASAGVSSAQDRAALSRRFAPPATMPGSVAPRAPTRSGRCRPSGSSRPGVRVTISITSARTAARRLAVAEFATGKSFSQALDTAPSPQAMCPPTAGRVCNPLAGPLWNGWGVNTSNTRLQDGAMAGFTAAQVPRPKLRWAFGFPGDVGADAQPTIAGGRVFVGSQSGQPRFTQRRHRLHSLVLSSRCAGSRGCHHRPHRHEVGTPLCGLYWLSRCHPPRLTWRTASCSGRRGWTLSRLLASPGLRCFTMAASMSAWPPAKRPPAHRPITSAAGFAAAWWR